MLFRALFIGGAAALAPTPRLSRRDALITGTLAPFVAPLLVPTPASAVVYLDPARYGDQELKNAAIAKCRTRVRDAIVRDPKVAPQFFLLALLDGLSYSEKTKKGGPDGTVAASIQLPGERNAALRGALELLQESQKALKRTNALTLADLIALAGAESVAAVGGPEISVQLGRTDSPKLLEDLKAVKAGGATAAKERGISLAFDVEARDPKAILAAFKRSGFTEREATVLLGTLAILESDAVVNASVGERTDKDTVGKTRGKMGRTTAIFRSKEQASKPLIDLYDTADGDEEPDIDKFDGDLDEFYIADAFGTRKEAYGKRAATDVDSKNFNLLFQSLDEKFKANAEPATWLEAALLGDANTRIWVARYGQERLLYLKDLSKTFYRITEVGASYTGGKYAALLEGRAPPKLD